MASRSPSTAAIVFSLISYSEGGVTQGSEREGEGSWGGKVSRGSRGAGTLIRVRQARPTLWARVPQPQAETWCALLRRVPSALPNLCTLAAEPGLRTERVAEEAPPSPQPRRAGATEPATPGCLGLPQSSWRHPALRWPMQSRTSCSLRSGFPGTHPVPTPESWRPARNARRPDGRPAKFRVPLQETGNCVPGSGKPAVRAWDSLANTLHTHSRRQGHPCRLNSCSVSLQF